MATTKIGIKPYLSIQNLIILLKWFCVLHVLEMFHVLEKMPFMVHFVGKVVIG
jgi:hypothetical protein